MARKRKPKRCEDCYWFEQCGEDKTCHDFTPLDSDEEEIDAYSRELIYRTSMDTNQED